jgi:hypothetical protein
MKKQFYKSETFWTVLLGTLGCFALAWNFINNPSDWANILVNFAQIGVAVIVFFIANNIFKNLIKKKEEGFEEYFEEYLIEWAEHNKYLIDASNINVEKGESKKRTIEMIVDHTNFVECTKLASEISGVMNKGAFLYLPLKKETGTDQIFQFKINKGMFKNRANFDYDSEKKIIVNKIANRINYEFKELPISAFVSDSERIDVDFSQLVKTKENAKRLIDVVEFVKTIYLAIA